MDINKHENDDLDWAAGLPHATIAAMHLSSMVGLVRAGWLVADPIRLNEVTAALDAMEVFGTRTMVAVAPVIDALDEEQRMEFFSNFAEDFPPEFPELPE